MNTLPQVIGSLDEFGNWSATPNSEREAGLPIGASVNLAKQARQMITFLAQAKISLEQLYTQWNQLLAAGNTTDPARGQALLTQLKATDGSLDQVIATMASFNVDLVSYEAVVRQEKNNNEARMSTAKAELINVQAEAVKYRRILEDARRRGDMQTVASYTAGGVINDVYNQQVVSQLQFVGERLQFCAELLQRLHQMSVSVTAYRNLANAVEANLEDAVRNESKALTTTRETLAKYYERNVGRELTELFGMLGG